MLKGKIIILNGVSSAGKTSLSRALQAKFEEPFYRLANDTFCDMIHDKFWDMDHLEAEYQALSLLGKTARRFADNGKNVIIDTVMITTQKQDLFKEYAELLKDYPVINVHVTCPAHELERREKARGDRSIGQAVGQLSILCPQEGYDITVDTYSNSLEQCADKIIAVLQKAIPE